MALIARRYGKELAELEPESTIIAAGALCWRVHQQKLQVLVIHRPRYNDWSWPKGKLDPGETLPECAVREIREEINTEIILGIPLPSTHYSVKGRSKEVWYWAAEITGKSQPKPDGDEVDEVRWVSPKRAAELLSMESDQAPLQYLVKAWEEGVLASTAFVLVRHAKAKPRSSWARAEGERPLAATGRRQALAVDRLLRCWQPARLVSSPWQRCVETLQPYLQYSQGSLKFKKALTEKSAAADPAQVGRTINKALAKKRSVALCTHRPVLPLVLKALKGFLHPQYREELRNVFPAQDPYLKPGAIVVCHQSIQHHPQIVAVEIYDCFDD